MDRIIEMEQFLNNDADTMMISDIINRHVIKHGHSQELTDFISCIISMLDDAIHDSTSDRVNHLVCERKDEIHQVENIARATLSSYASQINMLTKIMNRNVEIRITDFNDSLKKHTHH